MKGLVCEATVVLLLGLAVLESSTSDEPSPRFLSDRNYGSHTLKCLRLCHTKEAICPRIESSLMLTAKLLPCNDTCTDDGDCPSRLKCCNNGCGRECMISEGQLLEVCILIHNI